MSSAPIHGGRLTTLPISRGFSLVEIMVAMALSMLLLGGVVAIFASSRSSYETTERLSRIQENGRFALDQMTRDIRQTGYVGCSRSPTHLSTSLNNSDLLQWNFLGSAVSGYESVGTGTWSPAIDSSITSPADDSDVLVLRIPEPNSTPLRLQSDMVNNSANLIVPNTANSGLDQGDVAVAYSCEARAYFYVTSFEDGVIEHQTGLPTGSPIAGTNFVGNQVADISYAFRRNAEVLPMQTVVYYVRQSSSVDSGGPADAKSLWRRVALNDPEELVEGVQQMQLEFGRDTTGDSLVDDYKPADEVTDWDRVYSVRVAILQRSLEEYGTDKDVETYQLLDSPAIGPFNDRRLREVFTSTTSIRNLVPVE